MKTAPEGAPPAKAQAWTIQTQLNGLLLVLQIHALAIVSKIENVRGRLILTMVLNLNTSSDKVVNSMCRQAQVLGNLLPSSNWAALRVAHLTPIMREFVALTSVHSFGYRLRALLLDPTRHASAKFTRCGSLYVSWHVLGILSYGMMISQVGPLVYGEHTAFRRIVSSLPSFS